MFDDAFLASLSRLRFAVRRLRAVEGEGEVRRDRRGGRIEFAEHRPYVHGDDTRLLDWGAYARTGRFFVKEFEREEDLSVLLVVDASASMGLHGKLRAAQRLAYALAYVALASGSRVRVMAATDGELRSSAEVAGSARIRELGGFLTGLVADGRTDLDASLLGVPRAARGSRIVIVLSDLMSENDGQRTAGALVRRGDDVHVLHLHAAEDRDLADDRPVVLVDAETGERVTVASDAGRRADLDAAERERRWHAFASRHRVGYVPLDAAVSTEELVIRFLRGGGVLS